MATGTMTPDKRSPLSIALSVWKALMLREALHRLFASRAAWFWLLLEPLFHLAIISFIFAVIRQRKIGGMETIPWIIIGLIGFFVFRRTVGQMAGGVAANRALFVYRQVTPADAVLIRAVLEGILMAVVVALVAAGLALFRFDIVPHDPLRMVLAFFGLWLFATGIGFALSVVAELVPELGTIINLLMRPLYFMSGVLIPLSIIPQPYQSYLMYNPIAHGLEAGRFAFSEYYAGVQSTDLSYLYGCAIVTLFAGLVLQRRFAEFLITK